MKFDGCAGWKESCWEEERDKAWLAKEESSGYDQLWVTRS